MIGKRKRWIVLILLSAVAIAAWYLLFPNNHARSNAEKLRRDLQKQGFKTDLAQFDFRTSPETQDRSKRILDAARETQDVLPFRSQAFFRPIGSNAAVLLSGESALNSELASNDWRALRRTLGAHGQALDDACAALASGTVRYEPRLDSAAEPGFQYAVYLRTLSGALAARTLLALHDHRPTETWTNLLAQTRLATAWDTEPLELAHLMKFNLAISAARITWEAQHQHALDRAQLAALQNEWRRMTIFPELPATAELTCALILRACESERAQPANSTVGARQALGDFFDSPARGWSEMTSSWRQSRYRNFGSYEDEMAVMKFYSERERHLREAIQKSSWAEIRAIANITNNPSFQGVAPPMAGRGIGRGGGQGFFTRQRTLALRAAETEARRRLVLAALGVELFYLDHHEYPQSLPELDPAGDVPVDFMDGKPLRYRRINAQEFLLYSIGADCVDDGGIARWDSPTNGFAGRGFLRPEEPDMLWPRVASAEEVLVRGTQPQPGRERVR